MTGNREHKNYARTGAICVLALLLGITVLSGQARAEKPAPAGESPGSLPVIGTILISNNNIFDPNVPEEDRALYRLANRLHARTRPDVIRQQLLFEVGEPYSQQAIDESERILRSNRYIQDVSLKPVRRDDGVVDVSVTTSDVWTLMPKLAYSRSGGESNTALGVKEMNLLGTGVAVEVMFKSDVDRNSTVLKVVDRNLGRSWYRLATAMAANSDGHEYELKLGKPFYSLNSTDALDISLLDFDRVESLYDRGKLASDFRHEGRGLELFLGRSRGLRNDWARRLTFGIALEEQSYSNSGNSDPSLLSMMHDRRLVYPFIGLDVIQDHYEKSSNYDHIHRVEDRFLGTRIRARMGLVRDTFGSDRNAWLFEAHAQKGLAHKKKSSLMLATDINSRLERDGPQNFQLGLSAKYYKRQSESRLLFIGLSGIYGHHLDMDQYLPLGGDTGMRGYPIRFQTGDKRAVLTLEQRFFTDWYPFRLFRVGGAAFVDIGRTWGDSPVAEASDTLLKDVGFGLRLGSTRSGLGRMIHIDVAFPLTKEQGISDVQFLISTRKSF